jgi:hypothetical protein
MVVDQTPLLLIPKGNTYINEEHLQIRCHSKGPHTCTITWNINMDNIIVGLM